GRVSPPDGATFAGALIGEPTDLWLVANDLGYGFVVKLAELITRNRAGKAVLKLKPGAKVDVPAPIKDVKTDQLVAVSNEGHILGVRHKDPAGAGPRQGKKDKGHQPQEARRPRGVHGRHHQRAGG